MHDCSSIPKKKQIQLLRCSPTRWRGSLERLLETLNLAFDRCIQLRLYRLQEESDEQKFQLGRWKFGCFLPMLGSQNQHFQEWRWLQECQKCIRFQLAFLDLSGRESDSFRPSCWKRCGNVEKWELGSVMGCWPCGIFLYYSQVSVGVNQSISEASGRDTRGSSLVSLNVRFGDQLPSGVVDSISPGGTAIISMSIVGRVDVVGFSVIVPGDDLCELRVQS